MTPRLFSSSTVYFLRQLLEEFHRGEILLPRFHRPPVWDAEKRLELFDSIHKGIPLGSFTIWETHAVDIQPRTEFGPFVLPTASKRKPHRYLIDGEQRLMTLYLALYDIPMRAELSLDESLEPFDVFFDLDEQVFTLERETVDDEPSHYFPLRGLFDFRTTLRFQRELSRQVKGEKPSQSIEHIDGVVNALKECTIAVTTIVTDDLALATEVFKRVNSQGVPMSTAHLVNAMTWQGSSSLFDAFDEVRASLEAFPHWQPEENLSNELLLLVTKRLVGCNVDEENIARLALECSDRTVFERLNQCLEKTAAFLHERGLRNPAHIPDEWMIVMLARVFDKIPEPSEQACDRLEDFLWFIAYTESFDTANRGAIYRGLEPVALALGQGKPLRPTRSGHRDPLRMFDFKQPRSKAFAWMLAQRMNECYDGAAADTLAEYGRHALQMPRNPKPFFTSNLCGSRVLYDPMKIEAFRSDLRRGNVDLGILEAQVISKSALEKLRRDPPDFKEFVNIRQREINVVEDERFQQIVARLFPDSA